MYKIAVIGDRESALGFKALGLETVFADTADQGKEALHRLAGEDCAVIYITEQLARNMQQEISRYTDEVKPAIILIPGKGGSLGIGIDSVHKTVERAVGADILKN
ncbi:MAG: V-type ATP synthase subunit F [Peptococcaceae bacterium]|nr:V-type ATP synthase subunit F [Peptococcaceae bacterium]